MRAGDFLDQVLVAGAGTPPYVWSVAGLPEGLHLRDWGTVYGCLTAVPPEPHIVSLTVRDKRGYTAVREVPVKIEGSEAAAIDAGLTHLAEEEYTAFREPVALGQATFCLVGGGPFFIGYHPSRDREQHLAKLQNDGYAISSALATSEFPPASVHVDGFLMQQCEVTNAEYAEFVRETEHQSAGWVSAAEKADHPAVDVSFLDALAYCRHKTAKAAQAGLPLVYRLPTHWEWEKASKGPAVGSAADVDGSARIYPWGDTWGSGMLHDLNHRGRGTVDVFSHLGARSSYGVCDLAGNVSEWVDGGQIEAGTIFKHIRGASWCKAGQRYGLNFFFRGELIEPSLAWNDLGFRCVLELSGTGRLPRQAFVPLGKDRFTDGEKQLQFIGGFLMARFAVTNQEYAEFRPDHTFDARLAHHPVTSITHQDASDFCKWKTQRDGRPYWLPTRAEWERAYRGTEGRHYPWGAEYSRYRCNSLESGWGRTVAVWDLWEGATPEGIYNLCGNTFEWTREGEALGGSWWSTCETFGAEPYQSASVDLEGREDVGFRYVTY